MSSKPGDTPSRLSSMKETRAIHAAMLSGAINEEQAKGYEMIPVSTVMSTRLWRNLDFAHELLAKKNRMLVKLSANRIQVFERSKA